MLMNDTHTNWNSADDDTRDTVVALNTDGHGFWTERAAEVRVTGFSIGYIDDEMQFGELRVHFNTNSWRTDMHGLIYTDRRFESELIEFLNGRGFAADNVSYSEQGMQGRNYVSFDIEDDFIRSLMEKFPKIKNNPDLIYDLSFT